MSQIMPAVNLGPSGKDAYGTEGKQKRRLAIQSKWVHSYSISYDIQLVRSDLGLSLIFRPNLEGMKG